MKKIAVSLFAAAFALTAAAAPTNYALNAKATASSEKDGSCTAAKAVDGKGNTRWDSVREDNQWLLVDLGEARELGRIALHWEHAAGKVYNVLLSEDGEKFTEVFKQTNGRPGAKEEINFPAQKARFIKIDCLKRATQYGFSLWRVEAYEPIPNHAVKAKVSVSSEQNKSFAAANAIDGKRNTRWSSAHQDDQWIRLDFDAPVTVGKIVLRWEHAAAKSYTIQTSADGQNWSEIFVKEDGKPNATEEITIGPREVRAIKVDCQKRATQYGFSLWELEVYSN